MTSDMQKLISNKKKKPKKNIPTECFYSAEQLDLWLEDSRLQNLWKCSYDDHQSADRHLWLWRGTGDLPLTLNFTCSVGNARTHQRLPLTFRIPLFSQVLNGNPVLGGLLFGSCIVFMTFVVLNLLLSVILVAFNLEQVHHQVIFTDNHQAFYFQKIKKYHFHMNRTSMNISSSINSNFISISISKEENYLNKGCTSVMVTTT